MRENRIKNFYLEIGYIFFVWRGFRYAYKNKSFDSEQCERIYWFQIDVQFNFFFFILYVNTGYTG